MKKFISILVLLAALGIAGWFWLRSSAPVATAADAAPPVAQVTVVPLRRQTLTRKVEAFGVIAAPVADEQTVTAAYDGVVRRVLVAPGESVTAGERLLEIVPSPDAQLALETARSAQTQAESALAAARERFDLKLATRQELIAAQQADREARQRLKSYEARGLAGNGEIRAAKAGVVSRIDVVAGAQVPLGAPLLALSAGLQLEARLGIELSDADAVKPGQAVTLWSADRAAPAPLKAEVTAVGRLSDAVTGKVEVRAALPAGAALLAGERVRATITVQSAESLAAPRSAVLPEGDKQVLFTVAAGRAVRHEVAAGLTSDGMVGVDGADLQAGEPVVTQGNYELEDGMAVRMTEAAK